MFSLVELSLATTFPRPQRGPCYQGVVSGQLGRTDSRNESPYSRGGSSKISANVWPRSANDALIPRLILLIPLSLAVQSATGIDNTEMLARVKKNAIDKEIVLV